MNNEYLQNQIDHLKGQLMGLALINNALLTALASHNAACLLQATMQIETVDAAIRNQISPEMAKGYDFVVQEALRLAKEQLQLFDGTNQGD